MDTTEWLGLKGTHNPNRWFLPVTDGIATMGNFLFGGCGLGAAVEALESSTGRPVVWATAQYLSFAMVGEVVDLDVTVAVSGRRTTQARVVAHVGEREILTVNAALGSRDVPIQGQWVEFPEVPDPEACPGRPPREGDDTSVMTRLDMRMALGQPWDELEGNPVESGQSAMWVRTPSLETSAATLSILGDYVPFGISQTQGAWYPSNSLDNTIRVIRLVPTQWVLVDIRMEGLANGFGHGTVYLWSETGDLMAAASQSALIRDLRD